MEALLPLLQMRAHLLQQGPEAAGNRDRYASTASSGRPSMSSSSDPSSPTTPVSPPISLSSHLHLINSWKDQDPYHHHLSQQHFSAINSSNNQLYLSSWDAHPRHHSQQPLQTVILWPPMPALMANPGLWPLRRSQWT